MRVPLRRYWELLARHIAPQRGRFVLLCGLLLGGIAIQVLNPQIMRHFIDVATAGGALSALTLAALSFVALAVAQQASGLAATYVGEKVAWTATNALRTEIMGRVLPLDMGFHHATSPGALIERIDGDISELAGFFAQIAVRVAGNALLLVGVLVALALEDWRLGLLYGLLSGAALLLLNRVKDLAVPAQQALQAANADLFGFLEERLAGTEDIRSCGAVEYCLRGLYQRQAALLRYGRRAANLGIVVRSSGLLMLTIAQALAYVASFYLLRAGLITVGMAYVVLYYSNYLYGSLHELSQTVASLQSVSASTLRLAELRSLTTRVCDGPLSALPAGALKVELCDVSFAYVAEEPVLEKLSLCLAPGRVLGILGRTGSGKTTLARLLARLYDPTTGEVCLGGVDLRQAQVPAVRQRVALVTQEVQLFQATVRDNLTFFDRSVADERIVRALEDLELGDWLRAQPQGLDTRLEAGGQGLSAGEAQLLALARVFLRDPGLVILDEASSRLDRLTEERLERALDLLLRQRTAVIIAHRLGTVRRADEILILEQGRAVERGERAALAADTASRFHHLLQTGLEEVLA